MLCWFLGNFTWLYILYTCTYFGICQTSWKFKTSFGVFNNCFRCLTSRWRHCILLQSCLTCTDQSSCLIFAANCGWLLTLFFSSAISFTSHACLASSVARFWTPDTGNCIFLSGEFDQQINYLRASLLRVVFLRILQGIVVNLNYLLRIMYSCSLCKPYTVFCKGALTAGSWFLVKWKAQLSTQNPHEYWLFCLLSATESFNCHSRKIWVGEEEVKK